MNRTAFFLTPHQGDDAGVGVSQDSFQPGTGPEAREAIERVEAGLGLHRPRSYWLQPKRDKFSKNLYRRQRVKNDPH